MGSACTHSGINSCECGSAAYCKMLNNHATCVAKSPVGGSCLQNGDCISNFCFFMKCQAETPSTHENNGVGTVSSTIGIVIVCVIIVCIVICTVAICRYCKTHRDSNKPLEGIVIMNVNSPPIDPKKVPLQCSQN